MSTRERINHLLNLLTEQQLERVYKFIQFVHIYEQDEKSRPPETKTDKC